MNRLVLIDGNAILHRAYHALPPLTAPDGSIVNAVYGFTTMLYKLIGDLHPTHIAVAFDRPAPTFRKTLYKEYQATRPKLDDDLASQIPKVHNLVRAFGIKIFEKDGFEADDVIGTIANAVIHNTTKVNNLTIDQVIIVTGDRDLLQLVNKNTFVYMPIKGLLESKLYDEKDVKDKMGVSPANVPDLKALAGDSSDNYPGVAGIGPKTASSLVNTYGSVENLYEEIVRDKDIKLSEAVRSRLISGKETAIVCKDIATIRTNVPIEFTLSDLAVGSVDTPESRKILEDFHFPSLIKRLDSLYNPVVPKISKGEHKKTQSEKNEEQLSLI